MATGTPEPKKRLKCDISLDMEGVKEETADVDPSSDDITSSLSHHLRELLEETEALEVEEDTELTSDTDDNDLSISGTLSFDGDITDSGEEDMGTEAEEPHQDHPGRNTRVGSGGARHAQERIVFEVMNARTVKEGHSKYVVYQVHVVKSPGLDTSPAFIEKRYSQFDKLNQCLRKRFPHLLESVAFPKKTLTGNFKSQTIAERSRAFEQYLQHLHSIPQIATCHEFLDFFYLEDIRKGYAMIRAGLYKEAIPSLRNALHLQEKLLGETHDLVLQTHCAIVVAYEALDELWHAQTYSETALNCLKGYLHHGFLVPLLQTHIRLCWRLGKDKKGWEAILHEVAAKGIDVNSGPTLKDIVMNKH
ncbi:SNX15 [Branchiostoma lanceolatum]|uniref:SNX15 protein n=2 Tax=Branchiostoma lanceolatum TaxID=7740 RepID=A0A8K0EVP3_BRALA|nr:SNX15 [Branchiostoma lanceolatum]